MVNEGLGGDHAVEQLTPRIAGRFGDPSVGVRTGLVESHHGQAGEHGVEERAPYGDFRGIAMDTALQFDAG